MKIITFFSEKGGVGKSSFSIMYASWLKYKHGVKVALADFNERISDYRKAEIRERNKLIRENPEKGIQPFDLESAWPIIPALRSEVNEWRKILPNFPFYAWLDNEIRKGRLKDYDVVLCDFPGSLDSGEFMQILSGQLINLTVIPFDNDEMTINSTTKTHNYLDNKNHCMFLNKVDVNFANRRNMCIALAHKMMKKPEPGFPVLPDMVAYSERMTTIEKVDILRTTFTCPDFDSDTFKGGRDLGTENLFIDVTRELAKTADIRNTRPADLSFVDGLQKRKDNRQFTGSSFPEYEI